ncbi:substrate-binding domain-containing protein [Granulosicoccus antarcticus]|uniref:Tungstate-binding protein TupA n=1 Tax=Granulosicoccus antarcticus IMCC3135 TaxID=1192854 RepID=A0A2Z2NG59_9GAMM|nr:substrate-binding domain-containing protein [Granulosicoccus antarcticus]ASJ70256.1 Tungstate-binding protein TupA [Granulosicoccus antarcticus IMCC3135]
MLLQKTLKSVLLGIALAVSGLSTAHAENPFIVVQSTTSTQNSGLLDVILPQFTESTGIDVRVVAVGTGQAIKNASNGDGDVLLVHAKPAEEKFIEEGQGVERFDVMYNDFVLVGPAADPAGIAGGSDIAAAMATIADTQSTFASRGDDSGTHKAELRLWDMANVDAQAASGDWYRETGSGMGATLNAGTGMSAYVLTDRATWIAFGNKGDYQIAVEGDERLFNQYGVILVNPAKHANVKAKEGQIFIDWLIGKAGQNAIADFKIDGEQLFFPNSNYN